MSKQFPHIRNAIYNQPWAILPDMLGVMAELVEARIAGENEASAKAFDSKPPEEALYEVVQGVAILPLSGPLFRKANLLTRMSGATSYQDYGVKLSEALEDSSVDAILMHIDSPGGDCIGLAELASKIYNARSGMKPIFALADGQCCSAAYMLASQAEELYTTESSMVGSIGTIVRIDSDDRQKKNEGIDSIVIRSSELKAAGNGPLTPNQEQAYRGLMQTFFGQFKDAVVRGRPQVEIDEVATGQVWIGRQAMDNDLCDGVMTFDEIIAHITG